MVETLYSDEGVCTIRWDGQIDAVVVEWEGDIGGEDYRRGLDRALEAIRERDASKLLTDSQAQGLMAEADKTWTIEDWVPRAKSTGLEYVAVVYPADQSARVTVDMMAREQPYTDLERLFTDDWSEARDWIGTK
ncbi:hypothetical protein [Halorientalis halophila]|uniref:hypothetical protein n=1 Tax=Halorientalis halophila TaxID=3108499 RepID=UPI00300B22C1